MAATRRRRAVLPPLAVLTALVAAVYRLGHRGATYAVRGKWEGHLRGLKDSISDGDFGTVLSGLEPEVQLPQVSYSHGGVSVGVADGRLGAQYAAELEGGTKLKVGVDDERAWSATLDGGEASLRVRGQGADPESVFWEATQASHHKDVGDVQVQFNGEKDYNLSVARDEIAELAGVHLGARARASADGLAGRLAANRALPGGGEARYTAENPIGVYDLGRVQHDLRLNAPVPVVGGEAAVGVMGDASVQAYQGSYRRGLAGGQVQLDLARDVDAEDAVNSYNVSYTRSLDDFVPLESGVQLGLDDQGAYGQLALSRALGSSGLRAGYEARGRVGPPAAVAVEPEDGEKEVVYDEYQKNFAGALRLSNKLGYAQLSHGGGEEPRLRAGYGFEA